VDDLADLRQPPSLAEILKGTLEIGWVFGSDPRTGSLLRMLAATKPGGRLLELGTGTGMGTAWLLDGMDAAARLVSVDRGERQQAVARQALGHDARVRFVLQDGGEFLAAERPASYDLVFADGGPGKFSQLDVALALLRPGGLYVVDDMISFPSHRGAEVAGLRAALVARPDLVVTPMGWASGLVVCARR